jgi:hypothetical protein
VPTCIYCRAETTGKEGVPHVIPEALGANKITLPRGAECDKCNHYFGRKLEPMLYRYPGVALALQFWGIRGKKGRLRKKLGTVERTEAGDTRFGIHSPQVQTDKYGRRTAFMDLPPDPDFDMLEFRRALYRIVLSTVAMLQGAEYALDPKFDDVSATSATRSRERRGHSLKGTQEALKCLGRRTSAIARRVGGR